MEAEEIDDHKTIGLNVTSSYIAPSTSAEPKQEESAVISSSDESMESNDFSAFSNVSANLSESYSVIGTKGSPCTVLFSDTESTCSVKDNEESRKTIDEDDDYWNTDLTSSFEDESQEMKLERDVLKYTESSVISTVNDILLEKEVKHAVDLKYLNLTVEVPSNSHATEILEKSQDTPEKSVILQNKSTDKNNMKLFLSNQLDSNTLQTYSSQPFSTSHLDYTSSQDPYISSSKPFADSAGETIQSKWDKLLEDSQNIVQENDALATSINKDSPFLSKSVQSRITGGQSLESLKNKAENLSLIYNKFKNEMSLNTTLENISESKLPELVKNSFSCSSLFKNLRTDSVHKDSRERNECRSPLATSYPEKEIFNPLIVNEGKHAVLESGSSQEKLCKFYNPLDSAKIENSKNLDCQENRLQRNKFLNSENDSFHGKMLQLEFAPEEKRNGLGDKSEGPSINIFLPNQEIKYSALSNNIGGYNSQTTASSGANYKDTLIYCDYCKKTFSGHKSSKMVDMEKVEVEKELLKDSQTPSIDLFLQIFNTDNFLAKNILLAVSSKELANKTTYTNITKYLREKNLFNTKLLKDVKTFLQASVNAQVLKMKGRRYILSDGICSVKTKRTQDIKKKKEMIIERKKNLRKQVSKGKKLQTKVEKNTSRKSLTSKTETKSRKFESPSKNTGNPLVKKSSTTKGKSRPPKTAPKLSAGKKINRKEKKVEAKLLRKILIEKNLKEKIKK